jgi:hypothetical protein
MKATGSENLDELGGLIQAAEKNQVDRLGEIEEEKVL